MTKIREANMADIPRMLELGEQFYNLTGLAEIIPFNRTSTGFLVKAMLDSPNSVIFVMEHSGEVIGGIGGTVSPAMYNFDYKIMLENFWFVTESERGSLEPLRLIARLEAWATEKGAILATFGAFKHLKSKTLHKLYTRRLGYDESDETLYVKRI